MKSIWEKFDRLYYKEHIKNIGIFDELNERILELDKRMQVIECELDDNTATSYTQGYLNDRVKRELLEDG